MREDIKLVQQFDKNCEKRLDALERKAAREFLTKERAFVGPERALILKNLSAQWRWFLLNHPGIKMAGK